MKKILLLLLVLCSAVFATNWIEVAGLALVPMGIITAILALIGYGFGSQELKILAQEEIYQLILTIILLGITIAAAESVDITAGDSIQNIAKGSIDDLLTRHKNLSENLHNFSIEIGRESSQSYYCTLLNSGYNIAPCGSYRQLMAPLGLAFQMIGLSAAELESLRTLVVFANTYAFSLIFPVGLILRAFRITRGAGGLLIAFGISIYIILPITVIVMKEIADEGRSADYATLEKFLIETCDERNTSEHNYKNAVNMFRDIKGKLPAYLYAFFVDATLTTAISIFAFISGMRWLSRLAGADVDVSSLMKIA